MKKDLYPALFNALFVCPLSRYGDAFSAIKTRLISDFLPPHDREGLFALALCITKLRRSQTAPDDLAAFARATDRFLRGAPPADQIDVLLALHDKPHLSEACEVLLLLLFREL